MRNELVESGLGPWLSPPRAPLFCFLGISKPFSVLFVLHMFTYKEHAPQATAHRPRLEDSSPSTMCSLAGTQGARLGGKPLYPLSHLASLSSDQNSSLFLRDCFRPFQWLSQIPGDWVVYKQRRCSCLIVHSTGSWKCEIKYLRRPLPPRHGSSHDVYMVEGRGHSNTSYKITNPTTSVTF